MTKVITIFVRRADMTRAAFRAYYEGHHVPMGLAANIHFGFHKYVRNHLVSAKPSFPARALPEFDAYAEFSFRDMGNAVGAQAFLASPEGKALSQDELNFLDMTYHPSFSVEEHLIAGEPRGIDIGVTRKKVLVLKRDESTTAQAATDRVKGFAEAYAQRHAAGILRLTLDLAEDSPAGAPPIDAILTLWPKPAGADPALDQLRWPEPDFRSSILDIETLESPPELLGLS